MLCEKEKVFVNVLSTSEVHQNDRMRAFYKWPPF